MALLQRTERYAGWLHLSPGSSLLDEHMKLFLFESRSPWRYFSYSVAVALRRHLRLPDLRILENWPLECLPESQARPIHVELDGEAAGVLPAVFELVPDALTLLLPERLVRGCGAMENLTHTLTGIAISHTGLNRKTRFATLALILASNAPDVDIVMRFRSSAAYLEYHRGITHSFVGATGLAVILAALVYFAGRRLRPKTSGPPVNLKWLFFLCWIGVGGHLLLDYTNAYGIRLLLPFSAHWYAWDIMPILDLILWALLVAGLGLPALLRLVSEEVGARKTGYRRGAVFALASMVLLWGLRDFSHRRALAQLGSNNYDDEAPVRYGAFPQFSPFTWKGVVETESSFHILEVNALASAIDAEHTETLHKPEASPALDTALKAHVARVFTNFARFPWSQVDEDQDGYEVHIRDLRFGNGSAGGFEATIELDRQLQLQSESFSFTGRQR